MKFGERYWKTNPKIAVVTAVCGGKDNPLPVQNKDPNADYVIFTDRPGQHLFDMGWDKVIRAPQFSGLSRPDRRNAKLPKVLPFMFLREYSFAIWQDGGHMLQVPARDLIERYLLEKGKDVAAFMHGRAFGGLDHNCIYTEAEHIKEIGFLEDPAVIDEQVAAYRAEGFPENFGLSCNAGMLWKQSTAALHLQLAWWEQICRYSSRDQMSFFYCIWKLGMKKYFTYLPGHWERNPLIKRMAGHADPRK